MPRTDYLTYEELLQLRLKRPIDLRARRIVLQSKVLGVKKRFYVALPPGYSSIANRSRRYPVLYLFRGHEHEWIHRYQDKSRRGTTAIEVYRDLLAKGDVGPMILVFPGISSDDNRVPGLLVNFRAPHLAKYSTGIGTGCFEDYFLRELIPYVDNHYRTVPFRGGRAVDGFSLGGFQSIKIAAQHPDMFCSAGSFDGTFLYATERGAAVRATDRVVRNPMFAAPFGFPRDLDFVAANNPSNLIWRGERSALADVHWLIRSGPESAEPWQSNYYRTQHLLGIMRAHKLHNGIGAVFSGARHNWRWADRHLEDTLPLHYKAFS
ncbi:MAG TPA: alpha/beta hydrolase-fold protein [Chloroflexia bacterium]|nr:alpha/beta hydrolase-fold protein [Chloroflexia bacterium]